MRLGLFDLPAPLLQWIDNRLTTFIPAPVTVAIWAVIGAILCLELYRIVSPQRRIGEIKQQAKAAQEKLGNYDGEFEGAWPLMKDMLGLSLKRVAIVFPATLIAAYPVIVLLVWLSNHYGHHFPAPDEDVAVEASPLLARWVPGDPPRIQAMQPDGQTVLDRPLTAAVPVIHKRAWWNWLIANPAGYLPADAPVDEIRIDLRDREFFAKGPGWLRGWEAIFITVLTIAALIYKSARKID
ncbi:MAG: hypothetical protein ACREQ8_04975 [Woeseiaceae bacterium]